MTRAIPRHHGNRLDFEQRAVARELGDLNRGRCRRRLGVDVAIAHFEVGLDVGYVDEKPGDLHHVLEIRVGCGERKFQIFETLHRLGAEVAGRAGKFPVRRHAELSGNVDGAARASRFHDMGVTARRRHGRRVLEAMIDHVGTPLRQRRSIGHVVDGP